MSDLARRALAALLLLLALPAQALDGNDHLELELLAGGMVEGWFLRAEPPVIVISGAEGEQRVPLALITRVREDGAPLPLDQFFLQVDESAARLAALRAAPPPHPPPAVVAGLSLVWGGAGHAALGDWGGAAGYAIADTVLISGAAYNLFYERKPGPAISLLALDLVFRGYAAAEAARVSRARRALLLGSPSRAPRKGSKPRPASTRG